MSWQDYSLFQQQHEARLKKAAQERLIRLARAARPPRERAGYRALAWFGQRLAAWGASLSERYSPAPVKAACCAPSPSAARHA